MSARHVLLIGGTADGDRTAILYGDAIIVGSANSGEREEYRIVQVAGTTKRFDVAVPAAHALDGDWIMERLINWYGRCLP